jgi:hypothetical protein
MASADRERGTNELPSFSLTQGYGSGFASADFGDAEESNPSGTYIEAFGGNQDAIQGIVHNAVSRHLTEALPVVTRSPHLGPVHTNNWRKRLREIMIHQNETVLGFLAKPATEHATIGPVEAILRRYAFRQDVDANSIKTLKQLCSDVSGADLISQEITACLSAKGPSSLIEIKKQVNALIDLYKETGEKLMEEESQLKMKIEKMDKVQKRVSTVIELQTNDAMPDLTISMENYLNVYFRDMNIEGNYKNVLFLYQKHMALREAIQVFKTTNQLSTEPTCPICISDTVATAISPCGHTFCGNCAKRMVVECGVCRGRIRDRLKLYFT